MEKYKSLLKRGFKTYSFNLPEISLVVLTASKDFVSMSLSS